MRKSTIFSSGSLRRQIFKVVGIGIAGLFTYSVANAQLSGNYTINSGSPTSGNNFNDFSAFMTALSSNSNAIAGPVTVTVAPGSGPYSDQLVLPSISGAGAGPGGTRVGITFIGNGETLGYDANAGSENATVTLAGADYVTFQNLNITRSSTGSYKWGVRIYNSSNNVRFDSCTIDVGPYTSTSNHIALLASASNTSQSSGTGHFSNLEIWNSSLEGGYYTVRVYSTSTNGDPGFEMINSSIIDSYYYGLYLYRTRDINIEGCTWDKPTQSYQYGYAYYFYYSNNVRFVKNDIKAFTYSYFYYNNYSSQQTGDETVIANNFYMQNNHQQSTSRGIYTYRCNDLKVYYNSVNLTRDAAGYTSTLYPFYSYYSNNIDVRNNVFEATTSSNNYCYMYSPSGTVIYDYNTWYSENPNQNWYCYYNTTNYGDPASLISSSGTNANSQVADPNFINDLDLHINGANLYGKGTPIAGYTDDYDGTTRSVTAPSHGAHEFIPPQNDAGVVTFTQPVAQCADTNTIEVTVKNFGIQSLDSVRVYWNWTGNGSTSGSGVFHLSCQPALATGADTTIYLDDVIMTSGAPGYNFQAYTSMPNGVTDEQFDNDTNNFYTQTAMEGSFTIGGTTPDFATFSAAVNGLETFGVCGPVTFHARSGTYNERISLSNLLGTSPVNTVTFTTDTNNSGPVLLSYSSSSTSDRSVIYLDGASYITFDGYDLQNSGGNYAGGVYMTNTNNGITLNALSFSSTNTSSLSNPIEAYMYGVASEDLTITNCNLGGGYYGIRVYCYNNGGVGLDGFVCENNTITNSYYYGMYLYYHQNSVISGNNIDQVGGISASTAYGLMIGGYGTNYTIENNRVHAGYYGLYCYSLSGTSQEKGLIANNKILLGDTATGVTSGYYGLYFYNNGFMRVAHNTFMSQTTNGYTAYISQGGLNEFYNNIIARANSGTNLYINGSFAITAMDNNAYFMSNGASQGLSYSQGLGFDANGVEVSNLFDTLDVFTGMTTCQDTLVGAGAPLSYVTSDIDGGGRSSSAPTIGPHEYISPGGFTLGEDSKLCIGDSVVLGSNIIGATYSWTPNGETTGSIVVTTPGTYGVTVTSDCGVGQDAIQVEDGSSIAGFQSTRSWLTVVFNNTSAQAMSYMWDFGDGSTSTDMNPTHLYSTNGTYNVCLTAYGDCDTNTTCNDVEASDAVGINENSVKSVAMYPNPASDELTITSDGNVTGIEISNISGQVVLNNQLNNFNGYKKLDISSLTKGVYFVKIFTSEEATTKRLVVQK